MQLGILFGRVVEHLQFTHANVGCVATPRIADGEAIVATWRQLEFHPRRKVTQFIIDINSASLAFHALD